MPNTPNRNRTDGLLLRSLYAYIFDCPFRPKWAFFLFFELFRLSVNCFFVRIVRLIFLVAGKIAGGFASTFSVSHRSETEEIVRYPTGISTCDQLRELAFTGNVIPQIWYRVFVKSDLKHPKPHMLAINILADIVYWYRPREIRDEGTGQVIGYQKKFRDDMLQRSYVQIAEQFGCSAGQA